MDWIAFLSENSWIFGIVVAGSIVNVLKKLTEASKSKTITISRLEAIYVFIGAIFSGAVFALFATHWVDSQPVIGALAGMGAYLGVRGLESGYDLALGAIRKMTQQDAKSKQDRQDKREQRQGRSDSGRRSRRDRSDNDDWKQEESPDDHYNPNQETDEWKVEETPTENKE